MNGTGRGGKNKNDLYPRELAHEYPGTVKDRPIRDINLTNKGTTGVLRDFMGEKGKEQFGFKATGIGSVPSTDVEGTCLHILRHLPEIPFWPQFVKRSYLEDMSIQFSEGLPLLQIQKESRSLTLSPEGRETELVKFYDRYLAGDIDYFAISREYAPGLYELAEKIPQGQDNRDLFIKGQTVGPLTFAAGIRGLDEKPVLSDPDLLEAFTKGLAIKALWQAKKLIRTGRRPIIFLDEPYLSGFGSAFSPIDRGEVITLIGEIIDYIREGSDTLIGIHCCGNTDWSMLLEAGPDIINFDAFAYMDYFLLYPQEIARFIQNGGTIAWGIVPTAEFTGMETVEGLYLKLEAGLSRLNEQGVDPGILAENSILTPACGMGSMEPSSSDRVLELLSELTKRVRQAGSF